MPPTSPDLAETARRVARQLTALAGELDGAAGPATATATLHLPAGAALNPVALREVQAALSRAMGGWGGKLVVVPAGPPPGPSDPDVRDWSQNT